MASLSTLPDMTSVCHVEFLGHVQKQQQMRLLKKINKLSSFMYNPRAHMLIIYMSHHVQIQKVLPNSDNVIIIFFMRRKTIKITLKASMTAHLNDVLLTGTDR